MATDAPLQRLPPGRSNQFVADDQQPKVGAFGVFLDDDAIAFGPCQLIRLNHLLARGEVGGDAAAAYTG